MQQTGYILNNGEKILVLERSGKYGNYLRLRKSGKDGQHLSDEEYHLTIDNRQKLKELLEGKTVFC